MVEKHDERDRAGRTPLHYAAGADKDLQKVQKLLADGADVDAKDNKGMTPLHMAAQFASAEAIVKLLLESGADPNAPDNRGRGPLMIAVASSHNPAIEALLLEAGADPYQHGPGLDEYWPAKYIERLGDEEERRVFEPYLRK